MYDFMSALKSRGIEFQYVEGKIKYNLNGQILHANDLDELRAKKQDIINFLIEYPDFFSKKIQRTPRNEKALVLSFAQQRLWLLDQIDGSSAHYNMPSILKLSGTLDKVALNKAFTTILLRHESLRTHFAVDDQGEPYQVIQSAPVFDIAIQDLSHYEAGTRELAIADIAQQEANRAFDLSKDMLLRAQLLALSPEEHILLVTLHHIASDGWSVGILIDEFSRLYSAYVRGEENPLAPLEIQYADYAVWQREWLQGHVLDQQVGYWTTQLLQLPVVHSLPLDHARPALQRFAGAHHPSHIDLETRTQLMALCRSQEATLFMGLHAVFATLLSRYSNETDIVVGSPIANREQAEVAPLIGFFVNTLVLRSDLSASPSFMQLLNQSKAMLLDAYAHQQVPFEQLVEKLQPERSLSHSPLFQVMLVLQNNAQSQLELPGLQLSAVESSQVIAKYDLTLYVTEVDEGLQLNWEYNTDVFEASTITRMADHFNELLESLLLSPKENVFTANMLSEGERHQLLVEWNDTAAAYPKDTCIHELFERQVEQNPDAIAVIFEEEQLTYGELNERANQLAHYLVREKGVKADTLVGICVERSLDMVVGIMGILKAGGAYVPLDPEYPEARLAYMLLDANVSTVITQRELLSRVSFGEGQALCVDDERIRTQLDGESTKNIAAKTIGLHSNHLAYVIYTSGSTGNPKGVMVAHSSLVNTIHDNAKQFFVDSNSVFLASISINFDAASWVIWMTFSEGGAIALSNTSVQRGEKTHDYINIHSVTHLMMTPSSLAMLNPILIPCVKYVIVGGEACSRDLMKEWYLKAVLFNAYGPTEVAICSTILAVTNDVAVNIGKPISNIQLQILDHHLNLVPQGIAGELHIGGVGLARGYLNRADLTAEKFIANPFYDKENPNSSERLYKTGDLVRWLPDGNVEFLGRLDHQVKIRGFRIELGEIESCLLNHILVKDAIVLAKETHNGDKRLIAYVIVESNTENNHEKNTVITTIELLRQHLSATLPEYMIPAAFVLLDAFPLTPNGKVDRKALPEPDMVSQQHEYIAPGTDTEKILCELWQDVLGVERVGITDNFFHLGGHSLLAMRLVSRINQAFNSSLPLKTLFVESSPEALGRALLSVGIDLHRPALTRFSRDRVLPLSFAQQRLWLLDQIDGSSAHYNMPSILKLSGTLDKVALNKAFTTILLRHESLRTHFAVDDQGEPYQVIQSAPLFDIAIQDLSHYEAGTRELAIADIAQQEANRAFDLSKDMMLRAQLLKLSPEEHILLVTLHHIASDGWSVGILIDEFSRLYSAYVQGEENPLAPLEIQYADYAHWQREWLQGEVLDQQLGYWQHQLSNLPVVHSVPLDRARPAIQRFAGATYFSELGAQTSGALQALCHAQDATLFMGLHAAFSVLLSRYSNETDIVVGSPIANREQAEVAPLIGFFVNTLVLRSDLSASPSFVQLLNQSKAMLLDAYAHQQVPFEQIVERLQPERSLSHSALFQIMLVLQNNEEGTLELPGLTLGAVEQGGVGVAKYDLTLNVSESKQGLLLGWEYNTDVFEGSTITRMADHFNELLESLLLSPKENVFTANMLSEGERHQLLVEWNDTGVAYPKDKCVHELFERQVEQNPDAIAVIFEEEQLTYGELNERANQLAHYLVREKGVKPDTLVGICVERSIDMVVGILGILKAGGAYVPLDPEYPEARLAYMLLDANVSTVITQREVVKRTPVTDAQAVCLDAVEIKEQIGRHSKENIDVQAQGLRSSHLAYVIYTSGSTGNPKGVMVAQFNVVNFLLSMRSQPGITAADCLLAVTSTSFDIHGLELFLPLITGAKLVVASNVASKDPHALIALMSLHQVTLMQATPATWKMLLDTSWLQKSPLKILCGGEALSLNVATKLLTHKAVTLWNMYGPTETTIWSCVKQILPGSDQVFMGQPIANTQVYIVSSALTLAPVGVAGELLIGGEGVTAGYLHRPELTADKFIANPFYNHTDPASSERVYRTGDLVRWLPNGNLEFLGRLDDQVKVRGFRIELGDIESALLAHSHIKDSVVVVNDGLSTEKQLVAYVVPQLLHDATIHDESMITGVGTTDVNTTETGTTKAGIHFSLFYFGAEGYAADNKYELYLKAAKFADEQGFEAIWTPERHFDPVGALYPNPSILSAALATMTSRVKLRAGSVVLPLHDPIRIAEEWSVVDNLSNGRVGLAIASGWHTRDFVLAPDNFASRKKVVIDGIQELKALWAGNRIVRKDGNAKDVEIEIYPKPIQQQLPLWITAAGNPETFIEAGRLGAHVLTHLLGQTIEELAEKILLYKEALVNNGHDPKLGRVTLMIHTYIGDDLSQVIDQARAPFIKYMQAHISLLLPLLKSLDIETEGVSDADLESIAEFAFERYVQTASLIGTPKSVAKVVDRLKDIGVDELACLIDWMDSAAALQGLEPLRQLQQITQASLPSSAALTEHCRSLLPPYMVPSIFVFLDSLPLTPNGKVNRKMLPAPDMSEQQATYVAPRTETEKMLCEMWQDLLGVERVGTADNFFQLGGHSLLAMQVLTRLQQRGYSITARQLFEYPVIIELASIIDKPTNNTEVIKKISLPATVGLTNLDFIDMPVFPTVRYLIESEGWKGHFNIKAFFGYKKGAIDVNRLELCFNKVIASHSGLRVRIDLKDDGVRQYVAPHNLFYNIERVDLSNISAGQELIEIRKHVEQVQNFSLIKDQPLFRAINFEINEIFNNRIVFIFHHAMIDGASLPIIISQMFDEYNAVSEKPFDISGSDYLHWVKNYYKEQEGDIRINELSYWLNLPWNDFAFPKTVIPLSDVRNMSMDASELHHQLMNASNSNKLVEDTTIDGTAYYYDAIFLSIYNGLSEIMDSPYLLIELVNSNRGSFGFCSVGAGMIGNFTTNDFLFFDFSRVAKQDLMENLIDIHNQRRIQDGVRAKSLMTLMYGDNSNAELEKKRHMVPWIGLNLIVSDNTVVDMEKSDNSTIWSSEESVGMDHGRKMDDVRGHAAFIRLVKNNDGLYGTLWPVGCVAPRNDLNEFLLSMERTLNEYSVLAHENLQLLDVES